MANLQVLVKDWLDTFVGEDYPVSTKKPKVLPDTYILVGRTGGPREAMVLDRAEILVEVYNKNSNLDASNKADEIADRIIELEAFNSEITHASVNSVVDLDDLIAQYNRYQVYLDVYHRR
jgi:hypothetical protein